MSADEARKALDECEEDATEDARAESDARTQPEAEPVLPLVHSFEQTSDVASFWMRKFRDRRASRQGRPGSEPD
jgi:hypothetical protein